MGSKHLLKNTYELIRILGRGGMGTVYLARNIKLDTLWAIKIIARKNMSAYHLRAEPNIMKNLRHPGLPRVFDIFEDNENFYIIEDYIDGTSLDRVLMSYGPIDESRVYRWAMELCDILLYLHSFRPCPIIYRDLKPSNVLLSRDGTIKLVDFGTAREYKYDRAFDTINIGTRGYAAPEQYGASQCDHRSDIYSLGATLQTLVTGQAPEKKSATGHLAKKHTSNISRNFSYIIEKCMEADPNKRFQTTEELLEALKHIDTLRPYAKQIPLARKLSYATCITCLIMSLCVTGLGLHKLKDEALSKYRSILTMADDSTSAAWQNALVLCKSAAAVLPDRKEAYIKALGILYQNKQYNRICDEVEKFPKSSFQALSEDFEYNRILGFSSLSSDRNEFAVLYFKKCLVLHANDKKMQAGLAVAYAGAGDISAASGILEKYNLRYSQPEIVAFINARHHLNLREYKKAKLEIQKSMEINRDTEFEPAINQLSQKISAHSEQ